MNLHKEVAFVVNCMFSGVKVFAGVRVFVVCVQDCMYE